MPAHNTVNAYDAYARYPSFSGLAEFGDGQNTDARFAMECKNMETFGGVLQPAAACIEKSPTLAHPIITLARLYRRWGAESPTVLVASANHQLYWMLPDGGEWTLIPPPDGISEYQSDVWSWVNYEVNDVGSDAPTDVLLLSNAKDGMIMVRGDTLAASIVETPKKFGVIERYAERIWGGAVDNDPDILTYSAPFNPLDWEADADNPEMGAGDVQQPSWDGDRFTSLKSFGSQMIAFKKSRVWRVLGTNPGEYVFKEQYGGGAPYERTIAVANEMILALNDNGVVVYDGLTVNAFRQEYCHNTWQRMNKQALDKASACFWNGKYYLSIPVDGSTRNNLVVIYDLSEGTWLVRDDVSIESFLPTMDKLFFTSSTTPGKVWEWCENSWDNASCTDAGTKWVTPWNNLGYRNMIKGSFDMYLTVEVKDVPAKLTLTIQTDKSLKHKEYVARPVMGLWKSAPQKRIHFGGSGRRFRMIIESEGGACWRIIGGILVVPEIDRD